jgi:hypothetical protein
MLAVYLALILVLVALVPGYHGWLPEGTIEAALEDDVPDSVALGKVKSDMVEADRRLHDQKIEWGHAKAHAKAEAMEVENDYTHVGGFSITDILTQQGELFGGSIDYKIDPRTALDGEKDEGRGGDVEVAAALHKNEKPAKAAKEKGNIQPKVTREERLERQRKFKEDRKKREDEYLLNIQSGGTARQAMTDSAGSKGNKNGRFKRWSGRTLPYRSRSSTRKGEHERKIFSTKSVPFKLNNTRVPFSCFRDLS